MIRDDRNMFYFIKISTQVDKNDILQVNPISDVKKNQGRIKVI